MRKVGKLAVGLLVAMTLMTGCGSSASGAKEITVISREDGSGTRGAFIELMGIEEKDADGNKVDNTTDKAQIANNTNIMMTQVAGEESAIGYISLGSLDDSVKAVSIDGVEASVANVQADSYKVARPFNIATGATVTDAAQDFINFILSAEGQAVVADNKFIEVDSAAAAYASNGASGKVTVVGSSSVSPVMEKLKEAYETVNTDVTIEIQSSDSTAGMTAVMEGTCDIGMASRELKDSEKEVVTGTVIAMDGIAVIVNKENSVSDLSSEEVKEIFTGATTEWAAE